jgi:conjugal transfer pilus assembly protein TraE
MNPDLALDNLDAARAALKRQQFISAASVVGVLILAAGLVIKRDKVVLEPPVRTHTVTLHGDKVDDAWLIEMGGYVAHLMVDVSPSSVDYQQEEVLRITHPSTHGVLQQQMAVQAKRLKQANASTVFWLSQAAPDAECNRVALVGRLETYVNGQLVQGSSRTTSFVAAFQPQGGRTMLTRWREVPNDDIWLARALEKAAQAKGKGAPAPVPSGRCGPDEPPKESK